MSPHKHSKEVVAKILADASERFKKDVEDGKVIPHQPPSSSDQHRDQVVASESLGQKHDFKPNKNVMELNDPTNMFASLVPPFEWSNTAYDISETVPSMYANEDGTFGYNINVRAGTAATAVVSIGNLKGPYTYSGPVNIRASPELSYRYGISDGSGNAMSWAWIGFRVDEYLPNGSFYQNVLGSSTDLWYLTNDNDLGDSNPVYISGTFNAIEEFSYVISVLVGGKCTTGSGTPGAWAGLNVTLSSIDF